MEYMHKIKMMLCDELELLSNQELNEKTLDYIDKLTHAIKSIVTIMAMEDEGYSYGAYDRGYYRGRKYKDGYSRDDSYSRDDRYSRDDNTHYSRDYDRRDHYYSNDMTSSLDKLMQNATSPKEKEIIMNAMHQLKDNR